MVPCEKRVDETTENWEVVLGSEVLEVDVKLKGDDCETFLRKGVTLDQGEFEEVAENALGDLQEENVDLLLVVGKDV